MVLRAVDDHLCGIRQLEMREKRRGNNNSNKGKGEREGDYKNDDRMEMEDGEGDKGTL